MNRDALELLARRWRRHVALRNLGISSAVACGVAGLWLLVDSQVAVLAGLVALIITAWVRQRCSPRIHAQTIAEHLNRSCPVLEESAALWLRPASDLSLVESLQRERLNRSWEGLPNPKPGSPPSRPDMVVLAAVVLSAAFLGVTLRKGSAPVSSPEVSQRIAPTHGSEPATAVSATLEIRPPAYLGRPMRRVDGFSAEVEEGSDVLWTFVTLPHATGLELSGQGTNDSRIAESLGDGRFQLRRTITDNWVYQLALSPADGRQVLLPAMNLIQVRRDAAPRITWRLPEASRTILASTQEVDAVRLEVAASDDHEVAEVRMVLTVAKGSGEGLKFRDHSQVLQAESSAGSSNSVYRHSLNLAALGLEPGDELYVHVVAMDSRRPIPNESRTETRSVVWLGPQATATEPAVVLSGVRRIPQYFRSQRQLILDTEELLAEQPKLSETQFRERSESIGIDQKLLRLRYGQFLGEEFEPTSAGAAREAVAMDWAATLRRPAGQEAGQVAAIGRAIEATHGHGADSAEPQRPPTAQQMMASIAHVHDSPEAATFLDEQIKASLRGVLAAMWDAEGRLRTAQPAAALPAEYQALKLLKAIQQADRLSVGRVSFEPPPLNVEERRLRGELDAIPPSAPGTRVLAQADPDAEALRRVMTFLSGGSSEPIPSDTSARVDAALWRAAQTHPERYLPALEGWRSQGNGLSDFTIETLLRAVWSLLPAAEESPGRRRSGDLESGQRYLDALGSGVSRRP
jgi:hypothetical protein